MCICDPLAMSRCDICSYDRITSGQLAVHECCVRSNKSAVDGFASSSVLAKRLFVSSHWFLPHSATTVFCCWRLICGRFECHNVFKQDPSPHNSKQLSWLFFILEAYCWLLLLLLLLLLSTEFVQSRDVENIWQYVLVCGCVGESVCACVLRV